MLNLSSVYHLSGDLLSVQRSQKFTCGYNTETTETCSSTSNPIPLSRCMICRYPRSEARFAPPTSITLAARARGVGSACVVCVGLEITGVLSSHKRTSKSPQWCFLSFPTKFSYSFIMFCVLYILPVIILLLVSIIITTIIIIINNNNMYVMKNTTYEADPYVIFSFLLCFRSYRFKYSPRHTLPKHPLYTFVP